jgi:hypothetical protein
MISGLQGPCFRGDDLSRSIRPAGGALSRSKQVA